MFYRLRRNVNYLRFHRQISRLLETPPIVTKDAPLTIVSMVAAHDVRMYILAIKCLYRRLKAGKVVVLSDGISPEGQALIRKHISPIQFVPVDSISTGSIQKGGTWERLVYCIDRSATDYVVQMDSDILCIGPIPEVLECVATNRAFTLLDSEAIPKKALHAWVDDAVRRNSTNIVMDFEKQAPDYPGAADLLYQRASSGFAGFARGVINRDFIQDFHDKGLALMGARWKEWGTEQLASNFSIANSPDSLGLPVPQYLTWERHVVSNETRLYHFLGYCRFDQGLFARLANKEIDAMLAGS